jgi:hypothetical protein
LILIFLRSGGVGEGDGKFLLEDVAELETKRMEESGRENDLDGEDGKGERAVEIGDLPDKPCRKRWEDDDP